MAEPRSSESSSVDNLLMVVLDACGDYRNSLMSEEPAQRVRVKKSNTDCLLHRSKLGVFFR